jgi:16S rRNA (adenine1518-N6/adenine1519-N6)-dimethyltransferase
MRAKKSLGQNFLMHQAIAERIADAARLPEGAVVLEIGPGTGMLTRALVARAKKVIAVEADAELITLLEEKFRDDIASGKLSLVHADIRTFDPATYSLLPSGYCLVANIPYYITGEIIRQFLTGAPKPSSMTLLVQKEVAERIARAQKESLLSLSVKVYGVPKYEFTVPRGSFVPKPNVDSAVLSVRLIKSPFKSAKEESWFFEILRAGFAHKRKFLSGNLSALAPKDKVKKALEAAGIALKARAEDVALPAWRALALLLSS